MRSVRDIFDVNFSRDVILKNLIAKRVRDQKGGPYDNKTGANCSPTDERLTPPPRNKRGRPPIIRDEIKDKMIERMKIGKLPRHILEKATEESLVEDFGHSREAVNAAREAALLEWPEIVGNSNTDN